MEEEPSCTSQLAMARNEKGSKHSVMTSPGGTLKQHQDSEV